MENGRCRVHGGATPHGADSPHARHLRYSAYLPPQLLERAIEALRDPELLSLEPNIAVLDARIGQLFEQMGAERAQLEEQWEAVQAAYRALQQAEARGGEEQRLAALRGLLQALEQPRRAPGAAALWAQVLQLKDQRRKMQIAEVQRLAKAQGVVTVEQAMGLLTALAEIVLARIPSGPIPDGAKVRREITGDVRQLQSRGALPIGLLGAG